MDVNDLKGLFAEVNKRMAAALDHVKHELGGVRTGRASITILDHVHVDAYGTKVPINQVATLSVPEPTLIVAQPFDPTLIGAVEKAIGASDLGLNPHNDGKVASVPIRRSPRSGARTVAARPKDVGRRPRQHRLVRRETQGEAEEAPEGQAGLRRRRAEGLEEVRSAPTSASGSVDDTAAEEGRRRLRGR